MTPEVESLQSHIDILKMGCFQKSSYTNIKSEFKLSHLWREVKQFSFRISAITFPILVLSTHRFKFSKIRFPILPPEIKSSETHQKLPQIIFPVLTLLKEKETMSKMLLTGYPTGALTLHENKTAAEAQCLVWQDTHCDFFSAQTKGRQKCSSKPKKVLCLSFSVIRTTGFSPW